MLSLARICAGILVWTALVVSSPVRAEEEILLYESDIIVDAAGYLIVEETILVRAEGYQIRRGIYRDFPRRIPIADGLWRYVGFKLLEVRRDGNSEPYHTENVGDFIRIYIGDADVYIPTGEYTYTIRYQTSRQLRFFQNFDELFWNVTGNFWSFPIRMAAAHITLPKGAQILRRAAYTGSYGAHGSAYEIVTENANTITFATTEPLRQGEGLTVAVAWPKGFVAEPGAASEWFWWMWDNLGLILLFIGTPAILYYFYRTWHRVGRDPEKGIIIPLFSPPQTLSPAATSYVYYRGFDSQGRGATKPFIAALMSLAAKGYLRIVDENDEFSVESTGQTPASLPSGEKAIYNGLLGTRERTAFTKENGVRIKSTQTQFHSALTNEYEGVFFKNNLLYFVIGAIVSVVLFFIYLFIQQPYGDVAGLAIVALISSLAGATLLFLGLRRVLGWLPGEPSKVVGGILVICGVAALLIAMMTPLDADNLVSAFVPVAVGILGFSIIASFFLLRAPTLGGRNIIDKIEGFRLYLSVAEAERMNMQDAPDVTREVYEAYLPYAIGLGVEKPWSAAFAAHLAKSAVDPQHAGSYNPSWYRGRGWNADQIGTATAGLVSSMSSSMASAMPAPKSSSGSSGGGFSGGGGGGGGGGGW